MLSTMLPMCVHFLKYNMAPDQLNPQSPRAAAVIDPTNLNVGYLPAPQPVQNIQDLRKQEQNFAHLVRTTNQGSHFVHLSKYSQILQYSQISEFSTACRNYHAFIRDTINTQDNDSLGSLVETVDCAENNPRLFCSLANKPH